MQLKKMDLNLFIVFEMIYLEGNLTRAANRLNITQPTVSNALARLRRTYDDHLFVRSAHGVTPTPAAESMINDIRNALRLMQRSLDGNSEFQPATSDRHFRISINEIQSARLLPHLMADVNRHAPNITIQCFEKDRRELVRPLATGEIDLAIDIAQLSSTALQSHLLTQGDNVCIMRNDHPSAGEWSLEEFLTWGHIVVSGREKGSSFLEIALNRIGKSVTPKLRVQHYLTAYNVTQKTDLILVAPASVAEYFDAQTKPLPIDQPEFGLSLYWHRTAEDDPAITWLRNLIINRMKE